jgi:deazaflavin-dependent oxidoreductase (nitroreductase family)
MGILTPVAVRIGAIPWLPRFLPQIVTVDELLQKVTRGRVSLLGVAGLPNLVLTVPGRRSGIPRSTPLLCTPYDDDWLIAGSYFGGPKMPLWVHNLRATESATIGWRREQVPVTARELEGKERAAAWQAMLRAWPNYAKYEERTDRVIPVFRLTRG